MFRQYQQKFILAVFAVIAIGLTACGGEDTSSSTPPAGADSAVAAGGVNTSISLTGVVVDGYLKGATAFVDRNNNGKIDGGEPSGITAADGTYTLKDLKAGDEHFPIVVLIPADAIDSDTGKAVGTASMMIAPAPKTLAGKVVVSPITTMIKTTMDSTPGADKYAAADLVRAKLGVTNNQLDLFSDYVANKTSTATSATDQADFDKLHKVAQVVARAVASQVATVEAATAGTSATLADVIALITNQVITQLATIESEVQKNVGTWDAATSGDAIVSNATVPVDTYSANFLADVQNQINLTLQATQEAEANALAAVAQAEIIKQQTAALAAQAAINNASAQQANADAQAALAKVEALLAQAQADKAAQDQLALDAQLARDAYAQVVVQDIYTATQAQAAAVQTAIAADAYAYTAAQQAAVTQAVVVANTQQTDVYAAAQQAAIDAATAQAVIDAAAAQAATDAATAAQATTDAAAAQQAAIDAAAQTAAGNGNNVRLSVMSRGWDQNTGAAITGPITTAIVQVDGVNYPVDASGDVWVAGLDVGLHDVHIFADGYDWLSIYGYTADAAGNTFNLDVAKVGTQASTQASTGVVYYSSTMLLDVNMPAGYVDPVNGQTEMSLADSYGNVFTGNVYLSNYITDPYTFQQTAVYSVQFDTNTIPAFTTFTGTLSTSEVVCDNYGFNCNKTNFADLSQSFTNADYTTWGVPQGSVTIANAAIATTVPVSNTTSSRVVMDVNFSNSVLAVGAVISAQNTTASVVFSTTDIYGNLRDYRGEVAVLYDGIFDAYTGVWVEKVASSTATIDFYDLLPGSVVSGNLYVVESLDWNALSNYVDLGVTSITTTVAPYIQVWNAGSGPASMVVSAVFPIVPVLPASDYVVSTASSASVLLNITNSIYSDPYAVVNANNNGSAQLSVSFSVVDSYGNTNVYGGATTTTVGADPAVAQIYFWDTPAKSTLIGVLTVTETWHDYTTGIQTEVQFVDLGLQTLTTVTNPNSNNNWKGFRLPASAVAAVSPVINVAFPVVPPTPTTMLTVQSVTPPAGMVVEELWIRDNGGYSDSLWGGNGNSLVLPHTFSSLQGSSVLSLRISTSVYDSYGDFIWEISENHPVGATVNLASAFTTLPSINPYQQGGVINYDFGGVNTVATVGMIALMNDTTGDAWRIFTAPQNTSITLPTVPAAIANPWVAGSVYYLEYEVDVLGSFTYNSFFNVYFSDNGGWGTVFQLSNDEFLGNYVGVPYTY